MTLKSPAQSTTVQSVNPDDLKATSLVAQMVYGYQDPSDRKDNASDTNKDTHLYDYAAYQAMGYALFSKTQPNDFFEQLSQAQTNDENREIILQNAILLLNALIKANTSPEHLQAIKDGLPNFLNKLPWKPDNINDIQQELMDAIANKEQLNNQRKPKEQQAQMGQDATTIDFRAIAQGNVSKDEVSKLAEDFALDIRDVQLQLLREVTLSDFHNKGWEKLAQQGKYSTLSAIPQFNDKIKTTIENHLLRDTANRQELEKIYFFYLEVAEKAIANNDFMTASTIVGTLNSAAIFNLREKFDNATDAKDRVENLQKNFNPGFSYKAVRENHKNPPNKDQAIVPYMGVFTTDITFTEDGNPNGKMYKIEGKDVKKASEFKVKLVGNVLKPVVDLQERALAESRRPHQTNALETVLAERNEKSFSQDEVYNLSVARFPRKPIEIANISSVDELLKAFKSGYLPADMTITKDEKVLNGKAAIAEIAELALNLVEADNNLSLEHKLKDSALNTLLNEIEKSALTLNHSPENFEQRLQDARDKIKPTPEAINLLETLEKHENDAASTYFAIDNDSRQHFTQELKALQESNPDPFVKSKIGEVLKDLQAIDNYQSLVDEVKDIRSLAALPIPLDTNILLQHLSDIDKLKSAIETKTKESGPEVIRNHAKSIKKDIMEPDDPIGVYSRNIYKTLGQNVDSVLEGLYEEYLDKIMDTYSHPDNKQANDKRISEINSSIDILKKSQETQEKANEYSEKIEKEIKPLAKGLAQLATISEKLATFDTLEYRDKIELGLEAYALSKSEIPTIRAVAQTLVSDNEQLKKAIQKEQGSQTISAQNAAELLSNHDGPNGKVESLQSQLFNYQIKALESKKNRDPILESWLHVKVSGLISSQEALLDSPFPGVAQKAQENLNKIRPMYDGFQEKMDTLGKRPGFFVRRTSSVTAKDKENKDLKKQLKSALSHIPTASVAPKGYSTPLTEPVYSKEGIKALVQQVKDAKYDTHFMQIAYLLDKQMSRMLTRDDPMANDSRDAALIAIALITDYFSAKDIEHSYPHLKTIYENHERNFTSEVRQMRISNTPEIALVERLFKMDNYDEAFKQLARIDVNNVIKGDSPASDKALLQRWVNIAKHETSNLAKSGFQTKLNQEIQTEYKSDPLFGRLMLNEAEIKDYVHHSKDPKKGKMVPTKIGKNGVLRGVPAIKKTLSEYSALDNAEIIFKQELFKKIDHLLTVAQHHPIEEFRLKAKENLQEVYQLTDAPHSAINEKQRAFHDFAKAYPNQKQALLSVLEKTDLGPDPRAATTNEALVDAVPLEPTSQPARGPSASVDTQDGQGPWMSFNHEEGADQRSEVQIGSKREVKSAVTNDTNNTIEIQQVVAFTKDRPISNSAGQVQLNCPQTVLSEFQNIIENSNVMGAIYQNPYTNQTEKFPESAVEFTAQHLQILARNESVNVTGKMQTGLYNNLLSDDQIARIRCLVKSTNVAGIIQVNKMGGFPPGIVPLKEFDSPQKAILVDQAGFQWQSSEMNTGALFFYPSEDVPQSYSDYQSQMYEVMLGHPRPKHASENTVNVNWQGKNGKLDLDLLENGIAVEFLQALDAASSQGEISLSNDEKINFKFLKAGMGFFASGLKGNDNIKFEHARLQGILQALRTIEAMPVQERKAILGKVGRIELPFSGLPSNASEQYTKVFTDIEASVRALGLEWGGIPKEDVFTPREGYVNASTNCADPHAMIGNEGSYGSVDAAISTNANVDHLNAAYNKQMQLRQMPSITPKGITETPQHEQTNKVVKEDGKLYCIGAAETKSTSEGKPDTILQILHGYDFKNQPIMHSTLQDICCFLALDIDPVDIVAKMIEYQPEDESPNTSSPVQAAYSKNVALMAAYLIKAQPDIFLSRLPKTDKNPEGKSLYQQIYPVLKGLPGNSEEMLFLSTNIRAGATVLKTLPSLPENPEVASSIRKTRATGIDSAKKALQQPDVSNLKQSDVSRRGPKLKGKKNKQDLAKAVATDLFHQQTGILADITSDQIQSYKWGKNTNDNNAPITRLIAFSTNLANHIRDQILLSESLHEQKDILSHYIQVMEISIQNGDFNTAMAIESAISSSSISRLKLLDKLDAKTQTKYSKCRTDISADDMAFRKKLKENIALKSNDISIPFVIPPINFIGAENDKLGENPKEVTINDVDVPAPQYYELNGKVNLPLLSCAHSARVYIKQHLDNATEENKAHPIQYQTDIAVATTKHKLDEKEAYDRSLAILPRKKEDQKAPKHFQDKAIMPSDTVLQNSIQAKKAQEQAQGHPATQPVSSPTESSQSAPPIKEQVASVDESSVAVEPVRDNHSDSTDMDLSSRRSSFNEPIDDLTQARADAKAVLENPHLMQQEVMDYIGQHLPQDEFKQFKQKYRELISPSTTPPADEQIAPADAIQQAPLGTDFASPSQNEMQSDPDPVLRARVRAAITNAEQTLGLTGNTQKKVMEEIFMTELDFHNNLHALTDDVEKDIIANYERMNSELQSQKGKPTTLVDEGFSSLEDVKNSMNAVKEFKVAEDKFLERIIKQPISIENITLALTEFNTDYQNYLKKFKPVALPLEVDSAAFTKNHLPQSTLAALAIQPVQRGPRYTLLFKELIKNTEKDQELFQQLQQVVLVTVNISKSANEALDKIEHKKAADKIYQMAETYHGQKRTVKNSLQFLQDILAPSRDLSKDVEKQVAFLNDIDFFAGIKVNQETIDKIDKLISENVFQPDHQAPLKNFLVTKLYNDNFIHVIDRQIKRTNPKLSDNRQVLEAIHKAAKELSIDGRLNRAEILAKAKEKLPADLQQAADRLLSPPEKGKGLRRNATASRLYSQLATIDTKGITKVSAVAPQETLTQTAADAVPVKTTDSKVDTGEIPAPEQAAPLEAPELTVNTAKELLLENPLSPRTSGLMAFLDANLASSEFNHFEGQWKLAANRQIAKDALENPREFTQETRQKLQRNLPSDELQDFESAITKRLKAIKAADMMLRSPIEGSDKWKSHVKTIIDNLPKKEATRFKSELGVKIARHRVEELMQHPENANMAAVSRVAQSLPEEERRDFIEKISLEVEKLEDARKTQQRILDREIHPNSENMQFLQDMLPKEELSQFEAKFREVYQEFKVGQAEDSRAPSSNQPKQQQSGPQSIEQSQPTTTEPTPPPSQARDGLGKLMSQHRGKRPDAQGADTRQAPQQAQRQPLQPVALGQARTTGLQTTQASQAEKYEIGQVDNLSIKQFEAAARSRMGGKGKIVAIQPYPQRSTPSDPTSSTRGVQITIQAGENRVRAYADNVKSPEGKQSTKLSLAKNTPIEDVKLAIQELCQIAIASAKPNSTITIPQKLDGEKRLMVAEALKQAITDDKRFTKENAPTIKGEPTGSERRRVNLNKGSGA